MLRKLCIKVEEGERGTVRCHVAAQFELYNVNTGVLADPDFHEDTGQFEPVQYEAEEHNADLCELCTAECAIKRASCQLKGNAKKFEPQVPFERRNGSGDANA